MTNVAKILLSIVVVVVLTGFGYGAWKLIREIDFTTSLDGETGFFVSGTDSVNGGVRLREVKETRHEVVEGTGGCDVKMTYALVDETTGISNESRERMNDDILAGMIDFFPADNRVLDIAATSFIKTCQTDLQNLVDQMDDPLMVAQQGWTTDITYTVHQNEKGILSLALSNNSYFGGAHPNTITLFLTFDTATGKQIALRDVLAEDGLQAFEVKEKQWLIDNTSELLFEESLNEFKAYLAAPSSETTQRYVDDALFYVTPQAIGVFYNAYAIAPYASGPVEVLLPRAELGTALREQFR